jgi:iron(III) transport system substrate-binding protein
MTIFILSVLAGAAAHAGEAQTGWQTRWEKTLALAKREGKVVVAVLPVASRREAVAKFQEDFSDIRLEQVGVKYADFNARVTRERQVGQYLWDVFVTGFGPQTYTSQISGGWFDPLKAGLVLPDVLDDSKWLGGFDAGFMDKGKKFAYAFALNVNTTIYVNWDLIPAGAVRGIEDLLVTGLKGRVAWRDPRMGDAGTLALAYIRKFLGDGVAKRLLIDQEPVLSEDYRQLAEWIVRGKYPIAIGLNLSDLTRFQNEGLGLNVKNVPLPQERVTPGGGGVFLMNRAPNPNAAKVFVNWLLGQKAQTAWAQLAKDNSRRVDVPPGEPRMLPDPKKLDSYLNFNKEENTALYVDSQKWANSLLK